jgi:HlyD family secretion protein
MQSLGAPTAAQPANNLPNGRRNSRAILWILILVVLAGLAYLAYTLVHPTPPATPSVTTVPARLDTIVGVVNSTGQIAPWDQSKLSFRASGQIATMPVKVGDAVKKGDVVATLATTDLQIGVDQAQANLESAQAKLAQVQAGARPEDVATAQAILDAQQAKLAGMLAGGRPEDVKAAQAAVAGAQARLHALQVGPQPADVSAATTAVDQAQTLLVKAQALMAQLVRPVDPLAIQQAQIAVQDTKAQFWKSQATRDGICAQSFLPDFRCAAANAQIGIDSNAYQVEVNKLQILQEGPKQEDVAAAKAAISAAQAGVASAKARLAQVQQGALPDDIAQAAAAVDEAHQAVALRAQPFTATDVAQQREVVNQAQAQLALKKNPYTKADLDQATASVHLAQSQLALARFNVDQATLHAPFDGIVASVNASLGEDTGGAGGSPIVTVVDPNNLRLDASVDETDISRVKVGEDVNVTFDALAGQAFTGKVISIAPNAVVQAGVASYTVQISLTNAAGVRPGMTGNADIIFAHHDGALLVPNRAVRTSGIQKVVSVFDGSKVVTKVVTTGVSDDKNTEILSGLQVGDQVVIPSTAPTVPAFAGGPTRG